MTNISVQKANSDAANAANDWRLTGTDSRIAAFAIPTDEEAVIAEDACAVVTAAGRPADPSAARRLGPASERA